MSSFYGPVPEPDPGQPYNKYHWVKSAMQKLQSGCLKEVPLEGVCSMNLSTPLGMENGDILNSDIAASTIGLEYIPSGARLNNEVYPPGWCAGSDDSNPLIQVNFKAKIYVTGLTTQGSSNSAYVKTYKVKYGDSTATLTYVKTSGGSAQLFIGNSDKDSHVTNRFSSMLHARFLRINPVSKGEFYYCLRFEVLGCR
ncbi:lactadherin-like [Asterias rubens]|uniref:lactadherin-like n=1 Tax=Asterias rubens TaxID=7604 RepID=UPI0014555C79|nr:lactadherin-like [Asterias rubens]